MVKDEKEVSEDEVDLIRGFTDVVGLAVPKRSTLHKAWGYEEQLEKANERLKEVDKLKDEFVSLASHELRTPMTVIKSYAWMLLNQTVENLSEKQKNLPGKDFYLNGRLNKISKRHA